MSKQNQTNDVTNDQTNDVTITDERAINYLMSKYGVNGTPSELCQGLGFISNDPEKVKTAAKKELAVKDATFTSFEFPLGKLPIFSYIGMDGVKVSLSAPQLVFLLKNSQAGYSDTLTNAYLVKGGIDYGYEPIGATQTVNTSDNSALRAEFKTVLDGLTVPDCTTPDIVKNGRKPDQYRILVSDKALKTLFPDKFKSRVMSFLAQNLFEYLEFIRDDDDIIIGIVVKKIKE